MDALADPSLQRWLLIGLAVIGGAGVVTLLGVLWAARRPMPPRALMFRKRVGAVALFVIVAAGASFALLASPVDNQTYAPAPPPVAAADGGGAGDAEAELVSAGRFSSARLPALSLTAPDGWRLEFDKRGRKLTATSDTARLMVSTAILAEAVDVDAWIRQMAETQQALGFEVSATFSDRLGDLPASGFLATSAARSVSTWMVKRDTHLASSLICTAEGKRSAREACRAALATLRWRAPQR